MGRWRKQPGTVLKKDLAALGVVATSPALREGIGRGCTMRAVSFCGGIQSTCGIAAPREAGICLSCLPAAQFFLLLTEFRRKSREERRGR